MSREAFADLAVTVTLLLSGFAAVYLTVFHLYDVPATILLLLFGITIACVAYRFLGAVASGDSITSGIVKVGGPVAAAIAVTALFNDNLDRQLLMRRPEPIRPLTSADDALVGHWVWLDPPRNWRGELDFFQDQGRIRVKGTIFRVLEDAATNKKERTALMNVTDGEVAVVDHWTVRLWLTGTETRAGGGTVRLETRAPLQLQRAIHGLLFAADNAQWGVSLLKER
jgi:hypothetical protein